MTFPNRQILVVEDDLIQALDIERCLGEVGARVLGPFPSVREAMKVAHDADAAVLDITLKDCDVFPLADMLEHLRVPFVFYTGMPDSSDLPERFQHVQLIRKPIQSLPDAALVILTAFPAAENDDMLAILPKLRLAARLMYLDTAASDRLVERVLKDGIEYMESGGDIGLGQESARWLLTRMRQILEEQGAALMN